MATPVPLPQIEATGHTKFTDIIEWPNGLGYTPCTREFAEITDELEAILPQDEIAEGRSSDDLSPEDYQEFHRLSHERDCLMASGHVGQSVRLASAPDRVGV